MLREPIKIRKATQSTRVTEEVAEHIETCTGFRADLDSEARVLYHSTGRDPVLATQAISLEVNGLIVVESISCRQLEAVLQLVPELVSPEEKLIDFESSIAQEEEEEQLEMDMAAAEDASSNPNLDDVTPLVEEVEQRVSRALGNSRSIQPKRGNGGPRSTASSESKSARARRTSTTNMELEQDLADALAANDLQGFTPLLVKLRMISVRYVKRYSVKQLESAMRKVGGNAFAFTSVDRQLWNEFGLPAG